jgi:hypothetical protein
MRTFIALILLAAACAVVQVAVISSLPGAASAFLLAPAAVVWMVVTFRFREAVVFATAAGAATDLLRPFPFGAATVAMVAATILVIVVFTRVFSNLSPWIFAVMQAAGWLAFAGAFWAVRAIDRLLTGTAAAPSAHHAVLTALAGMVIEAAAATLILAAGRRVRRVVAERFLITRA